MTFLFSHSASRQGGPRGGTQRWRSRWGRACGRWGGGGGRWGRGGWGSSGGWRSPGRGGAGGGGPSRGGDRRSHGRHSKCCSTWIYLASVHPWNALPALSFVFPSFPECSVFPSPQHLRCVSFLPSLSFLQFSSSPLHPLCRVESKFCVHPETSSVRHVQRPRMFNLPHSFTCAMSWFSWCFLFPTVLSSHTHSTCFTTPLFTVTCTWMTPCFGFTHSAFCPCRPRWRRKRSRWVFVCQHQHVSCVPAKDDMHAQTATLKFATETLADFLRICRMIFNKFRNYWPGRLWLVGSVCVHCDLSCQMWDCLAPHVGPDSPQVWKVERLMPISASAQQEEADDDRVRSHTSSRGRLSAASGFRAPPPSPCLQPPLTPSLFLIWLV